MVGGTIVLYGLFDCLNWEGVIKRVQRNNAERNRAGTWVDNEGLLASQVEQRAVYLWYSSGLEVLWSMAGSPFLRLRKRPSSYAALSGP
jgi:hypothetical protein